MKRHHTEDTTFMHRAGGSVRKHAVSTVIASIIGVSTGTVIPMLENWHSDKLNSEQIAAVAAQGQREVDLLQKELDDYKTEQANRSHAMWDVVSSKQDKKENIQ